MILDVLRLEEKVKMYEGDKKGSDKDSTKLAQAGEFGEIGELKKQLSKKDKELNAMKKQAEGLQKEYDNLSVEYNKLKQDPTPKKDR